ncbi:MAG: helicase-associated domain-containing protein [Rectinemataceae bacterium]
MKDAPADPPEPGTWVDALLTSGSEALLGAVRNYIGPVRTPYDKRELARRLEAFLRRAETQESLIALLDDFDARLIGAALLLGPAPEHELKELFAGELPLFDLGVRVANLYDRLILFRYQQGGARLVAVNPLLAGRLAGAVLDPAVLFSPSRGAPVPGGEGAASEGGAPGEGVCDAETIVGFFAFLFHASGALRKSGGLTKRAAERAASLFPALAAARRESLAALAEAFAASGALGFDGEDRRPERGVFSALVERWGANLPFYMAAALAFEGEGRASVQERVSAGTEVDDLDERSRISRAGTAAALVAEALRDPPGGSNFVFSRSGLERWLGIASHRSGLSLGAARLVDAMAALGIVTAAGGGLALSLRPGRPAAASLPGRLVAEGAHALHLLPEASLEERLFVGCVARPISYGTVWSFEVERDSARRAFAAGLDAKSIAARLGSMSGAPLPQSLAFSLSAWEEEYRSLRLYRGVVLVADERLRAAVEHSTALGALVAEVLAPGVYFLTAASYEAAAATLSRVGLEASPRIAASVSGGYGQLLPKPSIPAASEKIDGLRARLSRLRVAERPPAAAAFDPTRRLGELREILGRALKEGKRSADEGKEFAERIERRIILTERQIAEAEARPERLEAGGLDYLGKVRVIERALRSSGDRLELLYRLPGAEPQRAVLRPVKLDRNEKGLVLEAEDLATGSPARIPLGTVSTVRRVRATLFGEDT